MRSYEAQPNRRLTCGGSEWSQLNLIEGLWGYLKRSALNNYFFGSIGSLEQAVHQALAELQQHPETALSLAYRNTTNLRKTA